MNTVIPALSSLVSFVFGIIVLDQFVARRKPYQMAWAIGLGMYFVSTGCEFLTQVGGLNTAIYRLWFLFGAMLVPAYLGMGTLYLLVPRKVGHILFTLLVLASIYAAISVATANADFAALPKTGAILTGGAMPGNVTLMTAFFAIFGTIALVGGAAYSAIVFIIRRSMPYRAVSNILIAAGALVTAAGGTAQRLGEFNFHYLFELVGIVLIFIGFLRSSEVFGLARAPVVHWFAKKA